MDRWRNTLAEEWRREIREGKLEMEKRRGRVVMDKEVVERSNNGGIRKKEKGRKDY